jgi:hypothetical protein
MIKIKKIIYLSISILSLLFISACSDTKTTYNVNFVMGNSLDNVVVEVKHGDTVEKISNPSNGDYQFLGWYQSTDYEELYDFDQVITENTSIYARFSVYELGKENYIAFKDDGKYGFMLPTGEVIIEAKYDSVEPFRYGYALVVKEGRVGFIDTIGNEFSNWYTGSLFGAMGNLQFTSDGITKVHVGDSVFRFINHEETILFDIENTHPLIQENDMHIRASFHFSDGRLPAYTYNVNNPNVDKCVFLDKNGDIALDGGYSDCTSFSNGLAAVRIQTGSVEDGSFKDRYVFINPQGDIVLDTDFNQVYHMFDGIQPVLFKNGYAIGRTALRMIGTEYDLPKYQVIDEQGNLVIEFEEDQPVDISDGHILTSNENGYCAIYDLSGNMVMDYLYKGCVDQLYATSISDGLVVLKNDENLYGAVDVSTGNVAIDFEYDFMTTFIDGYAVVRKDGLYGIVDTSNNIIVDIAYEDMFSVARTTVE